MQRRTSQPGRSWRRPIRRFVVADRSMEPSLVAGQALLAVASRRAQVGQLRVFEHPDRAGFWLVKRVEELVGADAMMVRSDNRRVLTADSATFGAVDTAGSYRVFWTSRSVVD